MSRFSLTAILAQPSCIVIAIEPCSATKALLDANIRLNNFKGEQIRTRQIALSDFDGEATLKLNSPGKDGLNTLSKRGHASSRVVGTEQVRVTTLDGFLEAELVGHVDFIKIDVEGGELDVFKGASRLLASSDAPVILYEDAGLEETPGATREYLEGFGYSVGWLVQGSQSMVATKG